MYKEYNLNFCHLQQQQQNWNGNCGNVVVPEEKEACLTSASPLEAARNHSRKVACGGSVRKSGFNNHTVKMLRKTEENLTKATTTVCGTQKMRVRERRAAAWRWRKGRERGEEEEQTRPTVSSSGNSSGSSCVAIAGI